MIAALEIDVPKAELDGNLGRSLGPWLVWKWDDSSLCIMGQDGGLIAEFSPCMGRGKANRDFCLEAVAALIKAK